MSNHRQTKGNARKRSFISDMAYKLSQMIYSREIRINGRRVFLGDAVIRSGWLPEDELKALIGAADAAVVPSLYEPFGMVALEAMSLGAPVVASRTGGLADIVIDGETGRSVPPGDPVALAGALVATLSDPARSRVLAREARALLAQRYDWGSIARDTVDCYRRSEPAG